MVLVVWACIIIVSLLILGVLLYLISNVREDLNLYKLPGGYIKSFNAGTLNDIFTFEDKQVRLILEAVHTSPPLDASQLNSAISSWIYNLNWVLTIARRLQSENLVTDENTICDFVFGCMTDKDIRDKIKKNIQDWQKNSRYLPANGVKLMPTYINNVIIPALPPLLVGDAKTGLQAILLEAARFCNKNYNTVVW
jgi:hypothetical protein